MPAFTKTVSQLTRPDLLSAANVFSLDATGSVAALRARLKAHIDANEHFMGNSNYYPLFSREQRAHWDARTPSPTPPPWGGFDTETSPPPEDDGEDLANPGPAIQQPEVERQVHIQLLESLPADVLARAINSVFIPGEYLSTIPGPGIFPAHFIWVLNP